MRDTVYKMISSEHSYRHVFCSMYVLQVHKSMAVVVQKDLPYTRCGVRSMQKTQGLTGIVLDIDEVYTGQI